MPPKANPRQFQPNGLIPTYQLETSQRLLNHATFPIFVKTESTLKNTGKDTNNNNNNNQSTFKFSSGSFWSPRGSDLGLTITDPYSHMTYIHEFDNDNRYSKLSDGHDDNHDPEWVDQESLFNAIIAVLDEIGLYSKKIFHNASGLLRLPSSSTTTTSTTSASNTSSLQPVPNATAKRSKGNQGNARGPAVVQSTETKETSLYPLSLITLVYLQLQNDKREEWLEQLPFSAVQDVTSAQVFTKFDQIFQTFSTAFSFTLEPIAANIVGKDAGGNTKNSQRAVSLSNGGFEDDSEDEFNQMDDDDGFASQQLAAKGRRETQTRKQSQPVARAESKPSTNHPQQQQQQSGHQLIITLKSFPTINERSNTITNRYVIPLSVLHTETTDNRQPSTAKMTNESQPNPNPAVFGLESLKMSSILNTSIAAKPAFDAAVLFHERMALYREAVKVNEEIDRVHKARDKDLAKMNSSTEQHITHKDREIESLRAEMERLKAELHDAKQANQQRSGGENKNFGNIKNNDDYGNDNNDDDNSQNNYHTQHQAESTQATYITKPKNTRKHGGYLTQGQRTVIAQKNKAKKAFADDSTSDSDLAF